MDVLQVKNKVLIVDDSEINRSLLSDILSPNYDILEASDGLEAVSMLNAMNTEISIILLDIVMPKMDGFEVLTVMNRNEWIQNIPVIMISSEISAAYIDQAYDLGATDYITRPFDEKIVQRRVQNTVMLYSKQRNLQNMVAEQIMERERSNSQMVEILSNIVEFRNGESGAHVLHIRIITEKLLISLHRRAPRYDLCPARIAMISNASALHDIGKISIESSILNKPGRLTSEEFEQIKTHTVIGAEMLERVEDQGVNSELLQTARDICRWHHERYDGRGYPDGLSGEDIPISAQVVALADVYDALTSERVYKPAFPHERAVEMIKNGECGTFNPLLLECLEENSEWFSTEMRQQDPRLAGSFGLRQVTSELISQSGLKASARTLTLLEQERMKYRFYASISKEIMFEYDRSSDLLEFSEWGAKYLGVPELIAHPSESAEVRGLGPDAYDLLRCHINDTPDEVVNELCSVNLRGKPHWFRLIARTLKDAEDDTGFAKIIGKLVDVHDEQLRLNELEEISKRDSLTGLYNQGATRDLISAALDAKDTPQKCFLLALIDLDKFKDVNDKHGHQFGDLILKRVAKALRRCIQSDGLVGRIGGDEFLLFMECGDDPLQLVERILDSASSLPTLQGYTTRFSLGAAIYPQDGLDYDELLRHADMSLYAAKPDPEVRYRFYDSEIPNFPSVRTPIEQYGWENNGGK